MALLRSNEYVDERGYTIIEEFYGNYDEEGKEIITATCKEEFPPRDENEEIEVEEKVTEEEIQAEILLNQAEIMAKQNEHDEVLAEILLNQMEV